MKNKINPYALESFYPGRLTGIRCKDYGWTTATQEAFNEIDRAMNLMIDSLRYTEASEEVYCEIMGREFDIDYDIMFANFVRYLEKVEQGL